MSDIEKKVTVSPFALLGNWLKDGNLKSPIPEECLTLPQFWILNYCISNPRVFVLVNKYFNNYNVMMLSTKDIFQLLKEIVYYTGCRQARITKSTKDIENKLCSMLREKYPYYRKQEVAMIVDYIDKHPDIQEVIYEQFGIRKVTSKKNTQKEFDKKKKEIMSAQNLLDSI